MTRFGIKWEWPTWDEEPLVEVPVRAEYRDRVQAYPYRTRDQAEGEVKAARALAPEVFANRNYEIVEEEPDG